MGEAELALRMQRGDQKAMREVYNLHAGRLMGVAARYLPQEEDRRDVLQEAMIKAFTHAGSFSPRGGTGLRQWLTRIVVNECLNFLKRGKRMAFSRDDAAIAAIPDDESDPTGIAYDTILSMIQQLPAGYRTVFNLYVFEKKSHAEIGRQLGISPGTSASQLLRAKRLLARQINEYRKQQE